MARSPNDSIPAAQIAIPAPRPRIPVLERIRPPEPVLHHQAAERPDLPLVVADQHAVDLRARHLRLDARLLHNGGADDGDAADDGIVVALLQLGVPAAFAGVVLPAFPGAGAQNLAADFGDGDGFLGVGALQSEQGPCWKCSSSGLQP
jgi:hypothetical protein